MKSRSMLASTAAVLLALPAGAQVKAGPELRANVFTTGSQDTPSIAVEPDGDFIVVWESGNGTLNPGQDGGCDGVYAQRYARDGSLRGTEFQVNTYTLDCQNRPDVAVTPTGRFVVVWRAYGQDGSSYGIFGQRLDAAGVRVGAEFQVNTYTTGSQTYPGVAVDGAGNFMVVWDTAGIDADSLAVAAQRFDAAGNRVGGELLVNSYTTGSQDTAKVAMHPDGRAVVVWESPQDGLLDGVFAQRFDASGNRVGAEFQVNTVTTGAQGDPSVGIAADGSFVVSWEDASPATQDVMARRFDAGGAPVGAQFAVNTYTTGAQFAYNISVDVNGNFQVAWDESPRDGAGQGVFGQRVNAANALRGPDFQVNTYTTGYQGRGKVGVDALGNFVVAWNSDQDPTGGGRAVMVQRFGGLFTTALAVDAPGNGVWEPGETAEVKPSWTNLNGAAQTFGGALSGITGPAGATYVITDGTAAYGTVADNATAPCTDCYGVSVDDPVTRPVPHWDASAMERITPDVQGQQKRWLLHIGASFTDVPTASTFYRFVETLLHYSVTGGCSSTQYCPATATTREQMAVFVLVAKEGAGYVPPACGSTPVFADVPASSPFCRWIEELARRGVVSGCGGGNYCPTSAVTREQMAVFVLRTLDPALVPPACVPPNIYGDVPETSGFCRWIEELTTRGVVTGCGGGNYCPTASVTREQMGVFISVTFGLTLYGP